MKTEYKLKYGHSAKSVYIDDRAKVSVFRPCLRTAIKDVGEAVTEALEELVCSPRLINRQSTGSVAIAVPDKSRPLPANRILPPLLELIRTAFPNLSPHNVTVVAGGGLHPPLSNTELEQAVSPLVKASYPVVAHDADRAGFTHLGATARGTPVKINSRFAEADLKIVVGQIDPHQFVGFTGGAKGVVIGCGSRETIEKNHRLMFLPGAVAGTITGNPVREDINEAGKTAGIDLALNAVMNADNRIAVFYAGRPEAVLEKAAPECTAIYGHKLEEQYDVAVASCGGYPKDICLYQAQKGLRLASRAVKPGGKIILLAECEQGVGDNSYLEYVSRFRSAREAIDDFKSHEFRMGAHKAYLFGLTLTQFDVVMDTRLDTELMKRCGIVKADVRKAVDAAVNRDPEKCKVAVVPAANITYFHED